MYGYGWGMPAEYSKGMDVWRLSDDKHFTLIKSSDDGKRWLLESLFSNFWVSIEDLRSQYSKEEPWAKQKAHCKKFGIIWKDKA